MKATAVSDEATPARKPTDPKQERPNQNRRNQSELRLEHLRLADEIWDNC